MNEDKYLDYAKALDSLNSSERELYNKKRTLQTLKDELGAEGNDGSCGVDITDHAFKQIAERLEALAMEHSYVYRDVVKPDNHHESLLLASNMKSFVITMLANAKSKGEEIESGSKSGGKEYRFTIDIKKWSHDKTLQFVAIVENNKIKTGFFNWV